MARPFTTLAALLLAAALGSRVTPARAESPPALSDAEVSRRLDFIQSRLELRTPAATRYWYGWFIGYTTVTTAEAVLAIVPKDRGFNIDRAVGAATASLGVLSLGVRPFPPLHAASTLAAIPDATPEQRRQKLLRGEHLLEKCAQSEVFGRSWVPHVLGVAVSAASGLVLAFAYNFDRKVSGLVAFASGVAVSELHIFTQPTAAIEDWRDYTSGVLDSRPARRTGPSFSIAPGGGALGLAGSF